jgi:DNA polymerase III delta subunit
MIVTLTGANDFSRKAELKKLVSQFVAVHTDMAVERYDGDESDAASMRGSLNSLPFLTERKMVVLYEPGKQKAFAEKIDEVLKDVADTTDLIIVEPKLDKRLGYYKTLKKVTDFRDFAEPDANGLAGWAVEYVKGRDGTLSAADARLLIDRVGPNQQLLSAELDKLLTYDPNVTKASIELLTERTPQSTVFELLDAAFAGNTKRAIELYHEQRALKVEPQAIIAMLAWQLHALALVKIAGTRSAEDIAREAKLNPFVVRKTQSLGRKIGAGQVRDMVKDLLSLDIRLKSVAIDADEALQLFLIRLART